MRIREIKAAKKFPPEIEIPGLSVVLFSHVYSQSRHCYRQRAELIVNVKSII
jgi:hypothetical protein